MSHKTKSKLVVFLYEMFRYVGVSPMLNKIIRNIGTWEKDDCFTLDEPELATLAERWAKELGGESNQAELRKAFCRGKKHAYQNCADHLRAHWKTGIQDNLFINWPDIVEDIAKGMENNVQACKECRKSHKPSTDETEEPERVVMEGKTVLHVKPSDRCVDPECPCQRDPQQIICAHCEQTHEPGKCPLTDPTNPAKPLNVDQE